MRNQRKIKLQPKYRLVDRRKSRVVPELRISGDWLAAAGFEAGVMVNIEISNNQLIIVPVAES